MATIRKRGTKFQAQIRRHGFAEFSKTFHKLADAKEWARCLEIQADRQELPPSRKLLSTTTLAQLVLRYQKDVIPGKKGAEIEMIILNAFLRHPICRKRLCDLNTADFAGYRDERLQKITAKSLKRQLSPIQNMFEIAKDEWRIPFKENPLAKLNLKSTDNKRERRLREGELERLADAAKANRNPYVLPIVLFALETAMRRGEMLSLRWGNVDLERLSVTVRESKNGHSRIIPLTHKALLLLNNMRNTKKEIYNGAGAQFDPIFRLTLETLSANRSKKDNQIELCDCIFPITPNALRLSWERICRRAGIGDLHFHDLRHEAISRLFELGLTVPEVASISGHRDMRMLLRYAHADTKALSIRLSRIDRNY